MLSWLGYVDTFGLYWRDLAYKCADEQLVCIIVGFVDFVV